MTRYKEDRPSLQIPVPPPGWEPPKKEESKEERGVIVIQLWDNDEKEE